MLITNLGRQYVCFSRALRSRSRQLNPVRCQSSLAEILEQVKTGILSPGEAADLIQQKKASTSLLESFANLDHERHRRTGFPEAVFADGKTAEQTLAILDDFARKVNETAKQEDDLNDINKTILATRVSPTQFVAMKGKMKHGEMTYHEMARIVSVEAHALSGLPSHSFGKKVVVATAGTTDLPVAEESAVTLEASGVKVERVFDVGVAGLHRVLNALPKLNDPSVGCVIVCAGMDGALPSVVGGLVSVPVIACPTSIGYGANFGGLSAMMTMLNSCSPG